MKQYFGKTVWALSFMLLVMALARPTQATSAVMASDADMIIFSRFIVSGRVISVTSDWDRTHSMVWTYVELRADRVLKGELNQRRIVLKQLGGSAGESGVRVVGQPEFAPGERVLLYLNTGADGSLHAAHGFMGKFSVIQDASGAQFVERRIDSTEVHILAGSTPGEITNHAPYDAYVSQIERTLRREAARVAAVDAARREEPFVVVPTGFSRAKKQSGEVKPEFVLFAGPVRWMEADSGQAIPYFVNPASSPVSGGASAEVSRAMAAWSTQSGASIQLQLAGQTSSCGIVFDNSNTISFGDCLNQLDPPIGCSGIVAQTAISWIRETKVVSGITFNRLLEADIVFNDGMNCFLANSANLAEVACHELGHSIGLGHATDPAAIMWITAHGQGRDATLGADDRAGVLTIYPGSTGGGGDPGPGGGGSLSIATLSVNDGIVGRRYSMTLAATGGTPPYRWTMIGGTLPSGLSLTTSGTLEGVPNSAGTSAFVAQVIDAGNPTHTDAKWLSITIRESGASPPGFPGITGVKPKGQKKLWVFGENFRADSLVLINGVVFEPVQFDQDGAAGELLAKGKLRLGAAGTNVVVVINPDNRSFPYVF